MSRQAVSTPAKRPMPRAPIKLSSIEDVSRYLTTITRMLHDDLITPPKANALRSLCQAKITSLQENKQSGTQVQIVIGVPIGGGQGGAVVEVTKSKGGKEKRQRMEVKPADSAQDELKELEAQIAEVIDSDD